jgi:hypothetical protein
LSSWAAHTTARLFLPASTEAMEPNTVVLSVPNMT